MDTSVFNDTRRFIKLSERELNLLNNKENLKKEIIKLLPEIFEHKDGFNYENIFEAKYSQSSPAFVECMAKIYKYSAKFDGFDKYKLFRKVLYLALIRYAVKCSMVDEHIQPVSSDTELYFKVVDDTFIPADNTVFSATYPTLDITFFDNTYDLKGSENNRYDIVYHIDDSEFCLSTKNIRCVDYIERRGNTCCLLSYVRNDDKDNPAKRITFLIYKSFLDNVTEIAKDECEIFKDLFDKL